MNTGRTRFKKLMIPWNKGMKGYITSASFKKGHSDLVPSKSRKIAAIKNSGSAHPLWKGDKVGYAALHIWIHRNYGFPTVCEECGFESKNHRKIQWANVSKRYLRERSDWKRLCCKCHFIFDNHPYHV